MLMRVQGEKDEFEQSIAKFQALRTVFGRHSAEIIKSVQLKQIRTTMRDAREKMKERVFSRGLRDDMDKLFGHLTGLVRDAANRIDQLHQMVDGMYKKFNAEHGFTLSPPLRFLGTRYDADLKETLMLAHNHFGAFSFLTRPKPQLVHGAFSTVASRVLDTFQDMNRDIEIWLKSVMTPLEAQVRDHQKQLRKRVDSIERIHEATDTLEARITELEALLNTLDERSGTIAQYTDRILAAGTMLERQSVAA